MTTNSIAFLALVIGAFSLFGGVLGWATWQESRIARKSKN